jgi:L-fuculose-phosphate aldolase
MNLLHPRDELIATMQRIYRYRMTTTSGGNLSIRDDNGDIWITPARVDKGSLRREDIVCVHPDGKIEGLHRPSSEFPFHAAIYANRPDLKAIVHAHPVALVAFSIAGQVPDTRIFHQSRHVCGQVGFAPYDLPGSEALGRRVAETFATGVHSVILENHGVVVGGDNLSDAFARFETLEFTAKTILKARVLGGAHYLTDEQIEIPRKNVTPLPERARPPVTSRERELRQQLVTFMRRGYQQRLMISTEGSFSARLNEHSFLITPYHMDRNALTVADIVLVTDGTREPGKQPSRAARNHGVIYQHHADVGAIVNAYTVNATAFSISGAELNTHTIPESYVFLRDVGVLPYGIQFKDGTELSAHISPRTPGWILQNDGMIVTGGTVLDTFDRLEVLETTAEAVINALALGPIRHMPESAIDELRRAFKLP